MSYKKLEEIAKKKGKVLLIESAQIHIPKENIEVFKETRLVESVGGLQEACVGILRRVPITRFVENKNNRIYSRALWLKVKNDGSAENSACLCNHPADDEEGSNAMLTGIWKNFDVNDQYGFADLYLIAGGHEYGRLLLNSVKLGFPCGMSTCGFGELSEGNMVDPESFEFLRTDWVLDPSQSVYATVENIEEDIVQEPKNNEIKQEITLNESNIESSFTKNKVEEKTTGIRMSTEKPVLEKLTESNIKNQVRVALKEARNGIKTKNVQRLMEISSDLKEISDVIPESMDGEKDKLMDMLSQVEGTIQESTEKLSTEHQTLQGQFKNMQEKYKAADSIAVALKEKYAKAIDVIKKLGGSEANLEKLHMIEEMQHDIKCLSEDRQAMEKDINVLLHEREIMLKDITALTEDRDVMQRDINMLKEDAEAMQDDLDKTMEDRGAMEEDLKEFENTTQTMEADIQQFESDREGMYEDIKQLVADRKVMKEDLKRLLEDRKNMRRDLKVLKEQYGSELQDDPYSLAVPDDKNDVLKTNLVSGEQDEAIASVDPMERSRFARLSSGYRVQESKKNPAVATAEPERFTESFARPNYKKEIENYYLEESTETPALERIKAKVLASKSLVEASRLVESFRSDLDDSDLFKFTEGVSNKPVTNSRANFLDGYL